MSTRCEQIETQLTKMRSSAARIEEIHQALVKEVMSLKDSVRHLNLKWDGGANSAFTVAMEADLTEIYVLVSFIWDAGKLLERAESRYQESEREVREVIDFVKTCRAG